MASERRWSSFPGHRHAAIEVETGRRTRSAGWVGRRPAPMSRGDLRSGVRPVPLPACAGAGVQITDCVPGGQAGRGRRYRGFVYSCSLVSAHPETRKKPRELSALSENAAVCTKTLGNTLLFSMERAETIS